jgi:6-phosphogluconolactonase/glucosamine-6-phosphate isomerase/deaminase
MITIQKVTSNVPNAPPRPVSRHPAQFDYLAADRQGQGDTRLTLTPSVILNSKYVIMVSD